MSPTSSSPMGLLRFIPLSYSGSRFFIPLYFLVVTFFISIIIFIVQMDNLVSTTKTMVGHNLEPTPWHPFKAQTFEKESKYSKASRILQCNYFKCGGGASNAAPKYRNKTRDYCPTWFSNIIEDLAPWAITKITKSYLEEAQKFAAFRVVIIDGKLSVDYYYACVQSRAMFTIWSFVQLLQRYPGEIPDVDLMFDCMDKPTIVKKEHSYMPLPLFRYCTTTMHLDIPFPDWSFWGWPEVNIKPWDEEFRRIKKGAASVSFRKRSPFAYWKGNPDVFSDIRTKLVKCNSTESYGAEILRQNWAEEQKRGFKGSELSTQCKHRYKIYAEGYAWSVSLKYILSCGSVPLIITPNYTDFFSRGLVPKENYFRITPDDGLCHHIKSLVSWGNSHINSAKKVGQNAQELMESLNMDRVYEYMYHLLNEYSMLLNFKPQRPPSAVDICEEGVLCFANELQMPFLTGSVTQPSPSPPCTLLPPYGARR